VTLRNFVGGEHVDAKDGRTSDVIDPSTGEPYARAPVSGPADVDAAIGGKAPVIVFDDADVATTAQGIAEAGYFNAGQCYGKDLSMYGFEDCTRIKYVMSHIGAGG
jgi:acyl-CoA reductase-like NAD-dependent aldehyde dehydrogenase